MLFGESAEAKSKSSDGKWVVQLPDEVDPMVVIFNIIHGRFDKVPTIFPHGEDATYASQYHDANSEVLMCVAKTADFYGVIHLLRPWAKTWIYMARKDLEPTDWLCELLWPAWLLGDEELLNHRLDRVVLSAGYADDVDDTDDTDHLRVFDCYDGDHSPADGKDGLAGILGILGIFEQLPLVRLRVLQAMLSPIRLFLFKPLTFIDPGCGWHMQLDGHGNDRHVVIKTFELALQSQGLFPLPGPKTFKGSPKDLQRSLDKVEKEFKRAAKSFSLLCNDCKPLKRVMEAVRGAVGSRHLIHLTNAQREHLARRRRSLGLKTATRTCFGCLYGECLRPEVWEPRRDMR
ncbi:hypothetical protein GE09DRAFT_766989 [Coniochaeta sp. 2T2.1]|nr:hypothetical protein GE09DRAFT_766989 [Coniochaeta sp. 2T2.1]